MNSVLVHDEEGTLTVGKTPIPKPGPGQVLIKVHSAPINPSDLYLIDGDFGIPIKYPFTPGWEGSGEVVEAGPGA